MFGPLGPSFKLEPYERLLMVPTAGNDLGGNLSNEVTKYLPEWDACYFSLVPQSLK